MLTEDQLSVVRRVLNGEISHGELTAKKGKNYTAMHSAPVVVAMILLHADTFCRPGADICQPWTLKGTVDESFESILGFERNKIGVCTASRKLGLHASAPGKGTWLTPTAALLAIVEEASPKHPAVVKFMRDARAAGYHAPEVPEGAEQLFDNHELSKPLLALAVLGQLYGSEPAQVAEAINRLPADIKQRVITTLTNTAATAFQA